MNFAIVILSYNQADLTVDCIKSIQAVKPRDFPDKQIFIVHNGSSPEVVQELRQRYPRFYHVVLATNEGFAAGANAGLRAAFQVAPWVLFLTQDTTLAHFPKAAPFEPCLAAVKIYKRKTDTIGSMGGAVDLETAKHYFCPKAEIFWGAFESPILKPFVPRTAFWIHQSPFEKLNGFDESLGSIWEDVDLSLRLREEGELLQLDEGTEVIHHRKGLSRKDPLNMRFLYHRNRFAVSRRQPRKWWARLLFEISLFTEWLFLLLETAVANPREASLIFRSYRESFRKPLLTIPEFLRGPSTPAPETSSPSPSRPAKAESEKGPKTQASTEKKKTRKKTSLHLVSDKKQDPAVMDDRDHAKTRTEKKTKTQTRTATHTEVDDSGPRAPSKNSNESGDS